MNAYNPVSDVDKPWPIILRGPNYYDHPDGTYPLEKLWGLGKHAILTSGGAALFDCCYWTQPQNPIQVANCVGYWVIPAIALSTTFASVTFMATKIRQKDDKLNYAIGAISCAPILHAWKKSTPFTWWGTGILIVAAVGRKYAAENNFSFEGNPTLEYGHYEKKYDFSLTKEEWPKRPF